MPRKAMTKTTTTKTEETIEEVKSTTHLEKFDDLIGMLDASEFSESEYLRWYDYFLDEFYNICNYKLICESERVIEHKPADNICKSECKRYGHGDCQQILFYSGNCTHDFFKHKSPPTFFMGT